MRQTWYEPTRAHANGRYIVGGFDDAELHTRARTPPKPFLVVCDSTPLAFGV
jgi:hypothetical protein